VGSTAPPADPDPTTSTASTAVETGLAVVGSPAAKSENSFALRLPTPRKQRSSKTGRGRAKLVSFVLTSADHIAAVEAKDRPNGNAQKKQKAKKSSQPDKIKNGIGQRKKRTSYNRPKKAAKAVEVYYCTLCRGRWGDSSHAKATEDWLECCICRESYHESCAEGFGILDDDDVFTCKTCFE